VNALRLKDPQTRRVRQGRRWDEMMKYESLASL
jgi:hypothetical protein